MIHLCQRIIQSSKYFLLAFFVMAFSSLCKFCFMTSMDSKSLPRSGNLSLGNKKKVTQGYVRWIRCLADDILWVLGKKFAYKDRCVGGCIIVVRNPRIFLPQIWPFVTSNFSQTPHNPQIILFIDFPLLFPPLFRYFRQSKTLKVNWNEATLQPLLGLLWMVCTTWTLVLSIKLTFRKPSATSSTIYHKQCCWQHKIWGKLFVRDLYLL